MLAEGPKPATQSSKTYLRICSRLLPHHHRTHPSRWRLFLLGADIMMKFWKNLTGPCPAPTYLPTYLPTLLMGN